MGTVINEPMRSSRRKSIRSLRRSNLAKRKRQDRRIKRGIDRGAIRFTRIVANRVKREISEVSGTQKISSVFCSRANSTQWNTGLQMLCLTPNSSLNNGIEILQGTADGERIGNKITPVKGVINLLVTALGYNAETNPAPKPLIFKYWIFSVRRGNDEANMGDVLGSVTSDFFDLSSSSLGLGGDTQDLIYPINKNKYKVYKAGYRKLFYASFPGSGATVGTGTWSNNDFKLFHKIKVNYKKYIPKNIVYDDNVARPCSKPVWMMWEVVAADGNILPLANLSAEVTYVNDFKYRN